MAVLVQENVKRTLLRMAVPMLAGCGVARMADAVELCDTTHRRSGADLVVTGYVHRDH